jgi:hypothetical protein
MTIATGGDDRATAMAPRFVFAALIAAFAISLVLPL